MHSAILHGRSPQQSYFLAYFRLCIFLSFLSFHFSFRAYTMRLCSLTLSFSVLGTRVRFTVLVIKCVLKSDFFMAGLERYIHHNLQAAVVTSQ